MLDLSVVLARLYPTLSAATSADLVWWTADDLYAWMDEAAKRLARDCGVFVDRDTTATVTPGTATYNVPTRHLSTIHISAGTRTLLPTSVQELEALDDNWPDTTSAAPQRWLHDLGLAALRLYPAPAAGASGVLAQVCHRFPVTITAGAPTLSAPLVIQEYFAFAALAGARAKESRVQMPEVAGWFKQLAGLMEQAIRGYWGGAQ